MFYNFMQSEEVRLVREIFWVNQPFPLGEGRACIVFIWSRNFAGYFILRLAPKVVNSINLRGNSLMPLQSFPRTTVSLTFIHKVIPGG
jgi:hypothetical protein